MSTYRRRLHALLTPSEHRLFARLDTPAKIQNFLDKLPVNFGLEGDTAMSPRRVLGARMAHCAEGAIFAAAVLAYHGKRPLLMDIRALPSDQDDRKSTRLNSSHLVISYAVFCLKKK